MSNSEDSHALKMEDRWAIFDLVARFDDSVNRRDESEFVRLWADDAVWEIEKPRLMRAIGLDQIRTMWLGMMDGLEWIFRGSFVGVLRIDADRATGHWPCIETGMFKPTGTALGKGYNNRALYEDIYVKREGRWLIQHRRYLYLWLSYDSVGGAPVRLESELDKRSEPREGEF